MKLLKIVILLVIIFMRSTIYASGSEIVEKRDFYSKTFKLGEGREKMVIYPFPIHFLSVENAFEEIPDTNQEDFELYRQLASSQVRSIYSLSEISNFTMVGYDRSIISPEDGSTPETTCSDYLDPQNILWIEEEGTEVFERRLAATYTFFALNMEPWYTIESLTHRMDIQWYTNLANNNSTFTFKLSNFERGTDITSTCNIFDSMPSGTVYESFDFNQYTTGSYMDEVTTRLLDMETEFQQAIETQGMAEFNLGYFLATSNLESLSQFEIGFSGTPTIELIINTTIEGLLANRYFPIPSADLGGTLSLINHDNSDYTFEHIPSERTIELNPGDLCTALTDNIYFGDEEARHYYWESEDETSYKIQLRDFPISETEDNIIAFYNDLSTVSTPTTSPEIFLSDPWYISNPEAEPQDWIQSDDFHPLSEMTPSGDYKVFLNHNSSFNSNIPIYSLKAQQYYVDQNGIYKFKRWIGTSVDFGNGLNQPSLNNTTSVVFTAVGATFQAEYDVLNLISDYELILSPQNEFQELNFPAGTEIRCAPGFKIIVEDLSGDYWNVGNLTIFNGTEEQPIVFRSNSESPEPGAWSGIEYRGRSWDQNTAQHLKIYDAEIGLNFVGDPEAVESSYFTLDGCEFKNNIIAVQYKEQILTYGANMVNTIENSIFENNKVDIVIDDTRGIGTNINNNQFINSEYGIYVQGYANNANDTDIDTDDIHFNIAHNTFTSDVMVNAVTIAGDFPVFINRNIFDLEIGTALILRSGMLRLFSDISYYRPDYLEGTGCLGYSSDYCLCNIYSAPTGITHFIHNNTIVGGNQGIYLDIQPSKISLYNNVILNQEYNADFDAQPFDFISGGGIVFDWTEPNPNDFEIGYNLFDGQYEDYQYVINGTGFGQQVTGDIYGDPLLVDIPGNNFHLLNGSPARDGGNPDLNRDLETWETDVNDQDPDGTRMDIGAYYYQQLSGTWSGNMVLESEASIVGDFTLNGDLAIISGTRVITEENSKITINGDFIVNGTSALPVVIKPENSGQVWQGVQVIGGEVQIDNLDVSQSEYVGLGLRDGITGYIRNSSFHLNTVGLRLHDTASNIELSNNTIRDNTSLGLNLLHASPIVQGNDISNNGFVGVMIVSGSSPSFKGNSITNNGLLSNSTHASGVCVISSSPEFVKRYSNSAETQIIFLDYPVNNTIASNSNTGVYSGFLAHPNLGIYSSDNEWLTGGFNHIYDNQISIHRNNGEYVENQNNSPLVQSTLWAEVNYWYENTHSENDLLFNIEGFGIRRINPAHEIINLGGIVDEISLLKEAQILEEQGQLLNALIFYDEFITTATEVKLIEEAVFSLARVYDKLGLDQEKMEKMESYLTVDELSALNKVASTQLIWSYKKAGLDAEAIALAEELIAAEASEEMRAYYTLEFALLTEETGGSILYKNVSESKEEEKIFQAQVSLLGKYSETEAGKLYALLSGRSVVPITPEKFEILSAYPNPFNPSVSIAFALPNAADVNFKIFDILGREVYSHVQEFSAAGNYLLKWNGLDNMSKQASSGLYIASITTPSNRATTKLMLLR
jgi:parallel beta-helix repeat protein